MPADGLDWRGCDEPGTPCSGMAASMKRKRAQIGVYQFALHYQFGGADCSDAGAEQQVAKFSKKEGENVWELEEERQCQVRIRGVKCFFFGLHQ